MRSVALCLAVSGGLAACVIQRETTIHEPENRGFENHAVTVIGTDPAHGDPENVWFDGHCVWLEDGECLLVDPRGTWCELESVPMDVVLAYDTVQELICYREREPVFYLGAGLGDLLVPHTGVGGTVHFLESSDGEPLVGDIFIRGDEIMVWGRGTDETVLDGDVTISGDRVQLRNLRITGNLTITSSAVTVAYVSVGGNLTSDGQSNTLAGNLVFGALTLNRGGNLLVDNGVAAAVAFSDDENTCDDNFRFTDRDANLHVAPSEVLGFFTCP